MKRRKKRIPIILYIAIFILLCFVISGIFADYIAPHNPYDFCLRNSLQKPTTENNHILGTDRMGRDVLSRIIYGSRVSLVVALTTIAIAGSIGSIIGIVAGYKGGIIDSIISRIVDLTMGLPTILIALILAVIIGPSLFSVIVILIILDWSRYARQARGETLKIRELNYVTLAVTAGCSGSNIMFRHILPNVLNSIIVLVTFNVGTVIIMEAALSFLGAGIPAPTPSWGRMVSDGRGLVTSAWWISFFPGLAITLVVLSVNIVGDWLRDHLDPTLKNI